MNSAIYLVDVAYQTTIELGASDYILKGSEEEGMKKKIALIKANEKRLLRQATKEMKKR